jgi:hypothetical protein
MRGGLVLPLRQQKKWTHPYPSPKKKEKKFLGSFYK